MPTCDVCEGLDFNQVDGFYYCAICQTQSQYLREIEVDHPIFVSGIKVTTQRATRAISTKVDINKLDNHGRPWRTMEGIQLLLQKQVEAVISLGAKPKIRDDAFVLWVKFLRKIGAAFVTEEEKTAHFYMRPRDQYAGTTEDPKIYLKYCKSKIDPKKSTTERKPGPAKENESELSAETAGDSSSDESIMLEDDTASNDDPLKLHITLVIIYTSLLYQNHLVVVSDIYRWLDMCLLPYADIFKVLDDDMMFQHGDLCKFKANVLPSHVVLFPAISKFWALLKLKPPELPIKLLSQKFIKLLNLPDELHGLITNLHQQYPIDDTGSARFEQTFLKNEAKALAYIVVMLKFAYRFDEVSQKKIQMYKNELENLQMDVLLFDVHEWLTMLDWQKLKPSSKRLPRTLREAEWVNDIKPLTDVYQSEVSDKKYTTSSKDIAVCRRKDAMNAMRRPFVRCVEQLSINDNNEQESVTQTDDSYAAHTLRYLTEPQQFVEELQEKLNINVDTLLHLGEVISLSRQSTLLHYNLSECEASYQNVVKVICDLTFIPMLYVHRFVYTFHTMYMEDLVTAHSSVSDNDE